LVRGLTVRDGGKGQEKGGGDLKKREKVAQENGGKDED